VDRAEIGLAGRIALFLLLANGLVLAGGLALQHWRDEPRLLTGYNADKVRLLGQPQKRPTPREEAAIAAQPVQPAQTGRLCYTVQLTDSAVYPALRQALLEVGAARYSLTVDERLGWWVHWLPVDDAAERRRLLEAARSAGVQDATHIPRGPLANSISLGMFGSEAESRAHSESLAGKGLEKVHYGPRPSVGTAVLEVPPGDRGRLEKLRETQEGRLQLDERECPETAQQAAPAAQIQPSR